MRSGGALLLLGGLSCAQAGSLFDDDSVIEATLAGPIEAVVEAGAEREEYPFTITVAGVDTPVAVRTRGNSRLRACKFPPLRLDFPKNATVASPFEGQDKLKLVTHCSDKRKDAGNVFDEYLAYRLFNLLSGDSYRVRLMRVRYVNTEQPDSSAEIRDAFLIESDEGFAESRNIDILEAPGVYLSKLDQAQAARVYVYQYLIANTDWSLVKADTDDKCCHNMDLFERDGQTLPVPYDFDLAGLVDASYAKPDPALNIRSVQTRRYRGYCLSPDVLALALDEVVALEDRILAVAAVVPAASDSLLWERLDFLAGFFDDAADRDDLLRDFKKRCL